MNPKRKRKEFGFFVSTFETQVHIKVSARTYTYVIWIKCRFSCLMTLDWLHQNNHGPQAKFSKPIFLKEEKEGTCLGIQ